ncbi:MAG: transposase, partial [Candidatus Binataceae bacterium]
PLQLRPQTRKMEVLRSLQTNHFPISRYRPLDREFTHGFVDHAERYVSGRIHTNGLENFWSLLKRGLKGTYISVEPFHLFRYLDEQTYRYNNRKTNDAHDSSACSIASPVSA